MRQYIGRKLKSGIENCWNTLGYYFIYLKDIKYNRIFLMHEPPPPPYQEHSAWFVSTQSWQSLRQTPTTELKNMCSSRKTFDSICVLICVSWRRAVRLIPKSYDPLIRLVHTQSSPVRNGGHFYSPVKNIIQVNNLIQV